MFQKKDKKELTNKSLTRRPTEWTPEMLKMFSDRINLLPISLDFIILEKQISSSFEHGRKNHILYRGIFQEFEKIVVSLFLDPEKSLVKEYKDYIGYVEIKNGYNFMNGCDLENIVPVPQILGFIKEDSGVCESLNEILIESKIFNTKRLPKISISLGKKLCFPQKLLNNTIPITNIIISQQYFCLERSEFTDTIKSK